MSDYHLTTSLMVIFLVMFVATWSKYPMLLDNTDMTLQRTIFYEMALMVGQLVCIGSTRVGQPVCAGSTRVWYLVCFGSIRVGQLLCIGVKDWATNVLAVLGFDNYYIVLAVLGLDN